MKNSKIIGLSIIGILTTSSIAFANDIKILTKDNVKYIPLKKIIQKSGGKVDISDDTAKITIDGKNIVIEKNLSFAKVNNNYYPLNKEEINGIKVPVDTKPIFEKGEVYIEKDFLKDNKIANYKIEKDNVKVILEDKTKSVQNVETAKEDKNEEKDSQVNHETNDNSNESNNISRPTVTEKPLRPSVPEKPSRPIRPSKPNRPNNGGNSSNNNNNNGGSVGNSGNNNSGGSEDNSGSNNGGNIGGENNSGSENNGNQAPGQPTPETPNDQPSTSTVE